MSRELDALRAGGGLLDAVVGSLNDVVFVLDAECRYYGIWGRWLADHDLKTEDFIGHTCAEVWGEADADFFHEVNQQVLAGEAVVFERWFDMPWGPVYYNSSLSPLKDHTGAVIGVCGTRRDITDLKRAEDAIAREKAYAQSLVESANVMVVGLDTNGTVRLFNRAAEEITGWAHHEVVGNDWFETVVPRDRYPAVWGAFQALYVRAADDARPRTFRRCSESPVLTRDGAERIVSWMDSEVPEADRSVDVLSFGIDITETKKHQELLEHLASHDPLTDLPNRRSFEAALGRAVARAKRGTQSSVLFIDVDEFKLCNDTYGHAFGDALLTEIARVLRHQIREPDLVARIGGDEFAALIEGADSADAQIAAQRMREGVARMAQQRGVSLDLSVGIMEIDASSDYESALSGADTAMYASKRSGSGVVVYQPEST